MTEYSTILKGKPACFALAKQLVENTQQCGTCHHRTGCSAALDAVYVGIESGSLTAPAGWTQYLPGLRRYLADFDLDNDIFALQQFDVPTLNALLLRSMPIGLAEQAIRRGRYVSKATLAKSANQIPVTPTPTPTPTHAVGSGEAKKSSSGGPTDSDKNQDDQTRSVNAQAPQVSSLGNEIAELNSQVPPVEIEAARLTVAAPVSAVEKTQIIKKPSLLDDRKERAYSFPEQLDRPHELLSDADLMAALAKKIALGFEAAGTRVPKNYAAVRNEFCAIAVELNTRQAFAPRFRSVPSLPWKPKLGDETNFALDMQVIDIHWRAHSRYKPSSLPRDYAGLFNNAPFDFETASKFALRNLPMPMKVVDTRITPTMALEHAVLQPRPIADLWRSIKIGRVNGAKVTHRGEQHVESILRESTIDQPHLASHVAGWVNAWIAYRLVGEKPTQAARMVGLMTGLPAPEPSAISKKYAAATRRLDAV